MDNKPKVSAVRNSIDTIISYMTLTSSERDVQPDYEHFREFTEIIVKKQHQQDKQMKLDFSPAVPEAADAAPTVEPSSPDDLPAADPIPPHSPQTFQ